MPKAKAKKCLIRGCNRTAGPRGVCNAHYQRAQRRMKAEGLTDDEMVALGLLAPKGESDDPMDKAIDKYLAERESQPATQDA